MIQAKPVEGDDPAPRLSHQPARVTSESIV
jgi:hypothetical protein